MNSCAILTMQMIIICDRITENPASTHNYKYLEMPILIIRSITDAWMQLTTILQLFIVYLYTPTVEWIAS